MQNRPVIPCTLSSKIPECLTLWFVLFLYKPRLFIFLDCCPLNLRNNLNCLTEAAATLYLSLIHISSLGSEGRISLLLKKWASSGIPNLPPRPVNRLIWWKLSGSSLSSQSTSGQAVSPCGVGRHVTHCVGSPESPVGVKGRNFEIYFQNEELQSQVQCLALTLSLFHRNLWFGVVLNYTLRNLERWPLNFPLKNLQRDAYKRRWAPAKVFRK